jgi:predicted transcriptional regulator
MYDDLNCKDLGQLIQLAQSTISKHIKELHDVGILDVRVIGSHAYYNINRIIMEQISDYIDEIYEKMDNKKEFDRFSNFSKLSRIIIKRPHFKNTA